MKLIGFFILIFNYMLSVYGWYWENIFGMILGASLIALGYKLERR